MTTAQDCPSCNGYGHFAEDGASSIDRRDRKCLDCSGTGTAPAESLYVGYDIDTLTFRDEDGTTIPEQTVRDLWEAGRLDATMMVTRLITQHNWKGQSLAKFYADNE